MYHHDSARISVHGGCVRAVVTYLGVVDDMIVLHGFKLIRIEKCQAISLVVYRP